jgi:hypothetical protein
VGYFDPLWSVEDSVTDLHPRRPSPPVRISAKPILPIIVEEPELELGTGEPY